MNLKQKTSPLLHESSALWLERAGRAAIRNAATVQPEGDQAVLRAAFGAISKGTEKLVLNGAVPKSEWARMACLHQEGSFDFPVKYGYCLVADVETGPADWQGQRVFCLHPHQTRATLPVSCLHRIPDAVPSRRAVLAANMETALNIVWDSGLASGMRLCVFGAGVVGLLVARIAGQIPGVAVTLVDIDAGKDQIATAFGADFVQPDRFSGAFDVLINVSASGQALQQALDHAAFEARIVEASWYGDRTVSLSLGGAFHSKRLSIVSSQVGAVATARRDQLDTGQRMQAALLLLDDPLLDMLFSGETAFADLPARYADILADPGTLCHRIVY